MTLETQSDWVMKKKTMNTFCKAKLPRDDQEPMNGENSTQVFVNETGQGTGRCSQNILKIASPNVQGLPKHVRNVDFTEFLSHFDI